jgi:hypothetical protein
LQPDAHGIVLRCEVLYVADTGDTLDRIDQIDVRIVAKKDGIVATLGRVEAEHH